MRRIFLAAVVVACVVGGVVVVGATAQSGGPPTGTLTFDLRFANKDGGFNAVNPRAKRERAGDVFTIHGVALQAGKVVGTVQATQTVTNPKGSVSILHGIVRLPQGDLVAEGISRNTKKPQSYAIVGGTGMYGGARGVVVETVVSVNHKGNVNHEVVTFIP
jgi:hypothetical protein